MNLNPITIISNVFALVLIQPLCWCCYKWICTIPLSEKKAPSHCTDYLRSRRKRSLKRKSHSASLCNWDSFRIGALVDSWLQTNLSSALGPDLESALRKQLLATTTIKIMNRKGATVRLLRLSCRNRFQFTVSRANPTMTRIYHKVVGNIVSRTRIERCIQKPKHMFGRELWIFSLTIESTRRKKEKNNMETVVTYRRRLI